MDGSGRVTKRNRQFLKKIIPFIHHKDTKLPLQQFSTHLLRDPNIPNHVTNTGPTADSREATTLRLNSQPPTDSQPTTAKSHCVQLPKPAKAPVVSNQHHMPSNVYQNKDGLMFNTDQTVHMSDADFDKGLSTAVQNVLDNNVRTNTVRNVPQHPKAGSNDEVTWSKRVKFKPQRYIQQI